MIRSLLPTSSSKPPNVFERQCLVGEFPTTPHRPLIVGMDAWSINGQMTKAASRGYRVWTTDFSHVRGVKLCVGGIYVYIIRAFMHPPVTQKNVYERQPFTLPGERFAFKPPWSHAPCLVAYPRRVVVVAGFLCVEYDRSMYARDQ